MSLPARAVRTIYPVDVVERLNNGEQFRLIDVREPLEHRIARLEGAELIPLNNLPGEVARLDRGEQILVMCHHGIRSASACAFLAQSGFENVYNLAGGIDRWAVEVDPTVPRY
jgi:rhodanese-related sulfurtransferase